MSTAPRYVPNYTVNDYQQWHGEWELIDGVPIAMTPSPFGPHERVVSRLARMIGNQIESGKCDCEVYTNLDWIVSKRTVVRPDVMVVCGNQPMRHLEKPPSLMIEVLSDSTHETDLNAKRSLAHENGLRNFLVVDPEQKTIQKLADGALVDVSTTALLELTLEGRCCISIDGDKLFDAE